jgi:outer membrane protein assembly factor BamB
MRYLSAVVLVFVSLTVLAEDWPQHLGPHRNGISKEIGLISVWPESGLDEKWRATGGVGMSGVSIYDSLVVTLVQKEGQQFVLALDRDSGSVKWETAVAPAFRNSMGNGPRAYPLCADGKAFVFTGQGILAAVNLADGKLIWKVDTVRLLQGRVADYGMACSPLLVNDQVVVTTGHAEGAALAAFKVLDGSSTWVRPWSDTIGYSSPAVLEVAGQSQIVTYTGTHLRGVSLSGEDLWLHPYVTPYDCNIVTPLKIGKDLFISSGENHGAALLGVEETGGMFSVKKRWVSQGSASVLRNEWQTSILVDGYLYGFDNVGGAGPITHLTCVEAATGKMAWQQSRFGKGNAMAADGKLFVSMMSGELIVIKISSEKYIELGRQKFTRGSRQSPALSDGVLFLRDDESIVAVDVKKAK